MRIRPLIVPALVPAAFLAGTLVNVGHSAPQQQSEPTIMVVDYMKVPPGGAAAYATLEKDVWKKIHLERQRQGITSGWALYRVRFPSGTAREYDFVTINTFRSLGDLDRGNFEEIVRKAVPSVVPQELSQRTGASRQVVRTDIWYLEDKTP
jgi:hypothetical protein